MTLSTFVPAPSLFSPWIANMHALRPTPPLHQLDSSHIPESYHKQRILNYINNINIVYIAEAKGTVPLANKLRLLTQINRQTPQKLLHNPRIMERLAYVPPLT